MNPLKTQVGGSHYTDMAMQPCVFTHANGIGHLAGDAIAYIARYKSKGGKQDLEKAIHAIQLLIALDYPEKPQDEPAPTYAIDWSKVPEGYDWVAMDEDGAVYPYNTEPRILVERDFWTIFGCGVVIGNNLTLHWFPPGTDWRETLTKRP